MRQTVLNATLATVFAVVFAFMLTSCAGESIYYTAITENGISYELDDNSQTATIFRYNLQGTEGQDKLTIPATVDANKKTYKVVAIGEKALMKCGFKAIELGENITRIDSEAFKQATDIKSVMIRGKILPTLAEDAFDASVYETARLYIPTGMTPTSPWDKFADIQEY